MQVFISNRKLKRTLEDDAERKRRFGAEMAKKIRLRMGALAAAQSLADFWPPESGPERCHELKGDSVGTFSMDLKHPYRLLFWPVDVLEGLDPADEKRRWQAIVAVEIVGIEDTHG
jgi:plasmid maintenance system killer protein